MHGGTEHEVRPRLVIAADGRGSSTRRQLGIELEKTEPRIFLAGMLVDGLRELADRRLGHRHLRTHDPLHFPPGRGEGPALHRLLDRGQDPLGGRRQGEDFPGGLPRGHGSRLRAFCRTNPAGPCAAYPMFDASCDAVVADGVVFAGDAAGFSDPTIGEGLSVALRDARMIRDVLLAGEDWSNEAFTPYVEERAERMRRLSLPLGLHRRSHPARA